MSNYIVTATGKTLNDYFQAVDASLTYTTAQITNFNNINRTDINANYLPFAVGNDSSANLTGYNYRETGTGLYKDLSNLFAMKITYTGTNYTVNSNSPLNNSTFITFSPGNGTIIFSSACNQRFIATIVMVSGGGGGQNGSVSTVRTGGGGGMILAKKIDILADGVAPCNVTVPAAANANTNGGDVIFSQGSKSINIPGGKSGGNGGFSNGLITSNGWVVVAADFFSGGDGGTTLSSGRNADPFFINFNNNTSIQYNQDPYISDLNYLNCCGGGNKSGGGTLNFAGQAGSYGVGGNEYNTTKNGGDAVSVGSGGGAGGYLNALSGNGAGGTGGPGVVHIFF